jgi:uncharacterized protein YdcH (DUF465 family)
MDTDQIKELLAREDVEFRAMLEEHHRYEEKLSILAVKHTLSEDEEIEEKLLKKRKLHLKDQMFERIRGYDAREYAVISK